MCDVVDGEAACLCDEGFVSYRMDCVRPLSDGDADADGDNAIADGDGGESDSDADDDGFGTDGQTGDGDIDGDCAPLCSGRQCGTDGCGGYCAPGCDDHHACSADGTCIEPSPGTWVHIRAGTFTMGSAETETGRDRDEDQHPVTLTRDFLILSTEVSRGEYEAAMGPVTAPFEACGRDCPIVGVSRNDALAYCNALSQDAGFDPCFSCEGSGEELSCTLDSAYADTYSCPGFRLPTEAEWEYAVRAGTTTSFYSGEGGPVDDRNPYLDQIGWYFGNSEVRYQGCTDLTWKGGPPCAGINPRARLEPNHWGLFDMSGNVFEWVWDSYGEYGGRSQDPAHRDPVADDIARGGSWFG